MKNFQDFMDSISANEKEALCKEVERLFEADGSQYPSGLPTLMAIKYPEFLLEKYHSWISEQIKL